MVERDRLALKPELEMIGEILELLQGDWRV